MLSVPAMSLPDPLAIAAIALPAAWLFAMTLNRRNVRRYDGSGDPARGTIVFVEPVRWWFIVWGFTHVARALRRSGYAGKIRLFRWSNRAGSLLVLPDLMRRGRLRRKAERLAGFIAKSAAESCGASVHVVGYSTGCYIAVEACRRADPPLPVGTLVLLAGTISPRYRLQPLAGRVRRVVNVYSVLDVINWVGPLLFGSNDRRWGPACGAVGFSDPPPFLVQRAWRPADLRVWYWGGHFSVASPAFLARDIAPYLAVRHDAQRYASGIR